MPDHLRSLNVFQHFSFGETFSVVFSLGQLYTNIYLLLAKDLIPY